MLLAFVLLCLASVSWRVVAGSPCRRQIHIDLSGFLFVGVAWALFALLVHPMAAHAQTAAPTITIAPADPNAIFLGPIVAWLQPFVSLVLQGLAGIIVTIVAAKLYSWFGVSVNAAQVARFKSAAQTEAGVLVAKESDNLKNASVDVNDPRIVAAANAVIARLPAETAAIGATPEVAAKIVLGELGKLQAGATAPDPVAAKV